MPIDKLEAFWMEQVEKRNAEIAALEADNAKLHKALEDAEDIIAALKARKDIEDNGTVPWEKVKQKMDETE